MANPTTYYGWVMPNSADLVTDLPADFAVFGQGVDTSMQYLLGGTTGQVLSKTSGTNMAFTWVTPQVGDITGVTAGTGISGGGTGGDVTISINTAVTADLTTAQTLTNKKLSDSTTSIIDVTDGTKAVKFDVGGTTAITGTIATNFTTAKTITIPDATDTLVGKATTDTLTNKTLTSPALTTPTISTATTNGDILYGTGSGALARLGIGSAAQVLTVASGIPSWATPASGGGMTLINSGGTTLSGTTTTVSSIPATYKQLQIIVRGAKPVTIDTIIALRLNTDTGTNYFAINTPTTSATGQTFNNVYFVMNTNGLSNDADAQYNSALVTIPDYATATNYKTIQSLDFSKYAYAGVTQNWSASLKYGAYQSATAISSISIIITGASGATAGTVFVYGVN